MSCRVCSAVRSAVKAAPAKVVKATAAVAVKATKAARRSLADLVNEKRRG